MRLIDTDLLLEEMSAGCIPIMEKGISGAMGDNDCIKDYIDNAARGYRPGKESAKWLSISEQEEACMTNTAKR